MELKVFQKIYAEAEEAIASRNLTDAIVLCHAILQDVQNDKASERLKQLEADYHTFLICLFIPDWAPTPPDRHFQTAIDILQEARTSWFEQHPAHDTQWQDLLSEPASTQKLTRQLKKLSTLLPSHPQATDLLDAAFLQLWKLRLAGCKLPPLQAALQQIPLFFRLTLCGALLLNELEHFSAEGLHLLIALAEPSPSDSDDDADELRARTAIALTILFVRYQPFFIHYCEEAAAIRSFMSRPEIHQHLPELLKAFTCQSLVSQVDKKADDILPIVRSAFEQQQHHLGTDEGADEASKETPAEDTPQAFEMKQVVIDASIGDRLFNKLAAHARMMEEFRADGLDINFSSFVHLKRFDFFKHPAHWFYPFSIELNEVKEALTLKDGKKDILQIKILQDNRFCSSDCYSYVLMTQHMRAKEHGTFSALINESFQEMQQLMGVDEDTACDVRPALPYSTFLQDLHRFFFHSKSPRHNLRDVSNTSTGPLPALPIFEGLFTLEETLSDSIRLLLRLGLYAPALDLTDYAMEHFAVNANTCFQRGFALMQLQQWKRALSAFQQAQLIDEQTNVELYMARCFEAQAQWEQALPLLQAAEKDISEEDDQAAEIIEETGRCLIELKRWDEAVQRFFRLEFMNKHLSVATRAIAWCSVNQGKYDRAISYYQRIIESKKATWEDRLNLGHALWLQGQGHEALTTYRESQQAFNKAKKTLRHSFRHWSEAFNEDTFTLLAPHFTPMETALMLDAIESL